MIRLPMFRREEPGETKLRLERGETGDPELLRELHELQRQRLALEDRIRDVERRLWRSRASS